MSASAEWHSIVPLVPMGASKPNVAFGSALRLLTVAVALMALAPAARSEGDAAAGAELAERLCAGCHAMGASDTAPHPEAPPLAALSSRYPVDFLAEALAEGISVGHSEGIRMPEFQLEPREIDDLIAYIEALQAPAGSPR